MATYESTRAITVTAGSAVSVARFIVQAADGKVDHVASAQGVVDGISGDAAALDDNLPMVLPDGAKAKVTAAEAIAVGALIASDNAGKAIALGAGNGALAWGRAVTASDADGDLIEILFSFKGQVNA